MTTWRELQGEITQRLTELNIDSSEAEARWMIEDLSGYDATQLAIHANENFGSDTLETLNAWLKRRGNGEPLQYILGHWSFRGFDILVDERVLIPRPETELVAQTVVNILRAEPSDKELLVADLGTGSGAIAISVANEVPHARVYATDISKPALELARINATNAGFDENHVRFVESNWFEALPSEFRGKFNLIVSNPPYIADREIEHLPDDVRMFEPREALVSGPDGLDATRSILSEAFDWLVPGGHVVLEIAEQRAPETIGLAREYGFAHARIEEDYAGKQRCLIAS